MEKEIITTVKLVASEGMILTNGTDYARVAFLATDADPSAWYEITEAEYEAIVAEQEIPLPGESF